MGDAITLDADSSQLHCRHPLGLARPHRLATASLVLLILFLLDNSFLFHRPLAQSREMDILLDLHLLPYMTYYHPVKSDGIRPLPPSHKGLRG